MFRKSSLLGGLILLTLSAAVRADSGPYYLAPQGFCNVYKVFLTDDGYIYGTEVGCSSSVGLVRGGFWAGGYRFTIAYPSVNTNLVPDGGVIILVYDLANTTRTRAITYGSSLTRLDIVPFDLTATPPYTPSAPKAPGLTGPPDESLLH